MREKLFLKLRGAVAGKGYNLSTLADHLGITQQSLVNKMYGEKEFTLEEVIKTCNFLDAPVDIFFEPQLHNLQFLKLQKTS
jgi:DNA-binding XRE family transcriptional regulator